MEQRDRVRRVGAFFEFFPVLVTQYHVTQFHVTPYHVGQFHVTLYPLTKYPATPYQPATSSGDGFASPRSTRFTTSCIRAWMGARMPISLPRAAMKPLM